MDAFAARQLQKRKAERERIAQQTALDERTQADKMTEDDKRKMNQMLGIMDPPTAVFAVGKDGAAGVWWKWEFDPDSPDAQATDHRASPLSYDYSPNVAASRLAAEKEREKRQQEKEALRVSMAGKSTGGKPSGILLREDSTKSGHSAAAVVGGVGGLARSLSSKFSWGRQQSSKSIDANSDEEGDEELSDEQKEARKIAGEQRRLLGVIASVEIHRYRKDRSRGEEGEWQYKGYVAYDTLTRSQVVVDGLTNDYEYRFVIKVANVRGLSIGSAPSNPVMVESPLPSGWFRFPYKPPPATAPTPTHGGNPLQASSSSSVPRSLNKSVDGSGSPTQLRGILNSPTSRSFKSSKSFSETVPAAAPVYYPSYYYANTKTGHSSWTRPELDPYFLDESIVLQFSQRELSHLRALFDEDMAHFQGITVDRFVTDILREIGEKPFSKRWVARLFNGYSPAQKDKLAAGKAGKKARKGTKGGGNSSPQTRGSRSGSRDEAESENSVSTSYIGNHAVTPKRGKQQRQQQQQQAGGGVDDDDDETVVSALGAKKELKISSWAHFMEVVHHIKTQRRKNDRWWLRPWQFLTVCLARAKVKVVLNPRRNKLGDWRIEYNALAERAFYRNVSTGDTSWSMPDEVKYYIPRSLEAKLLRVFDFGQLEAFKHYFSLLDVDCSGDLSDTEVKLLLTALGIQIDSRRLEVLMHSIDLNGNGTVEFDEFCFLMMELYRKDVKSSVLADLHQSDFVDDDDKEEDDGEAGLLGKTGHSSMRSSTRTQGQQAAEPVRHLFDQSKSGLWTSPVFSGSGAGSGSAADTHDSAGRAQIVAQQKVEEDAEEEQEILQKLTFGRVESIVQAMAKFSALSLSRSPSRRAAPQTHSQPGSPAKSTGIARFFTSSGSKKTGLQGTAGVSEVETFENMSESAKNVSFQEHPSQENRGLSIDTGFGASLDWNGSSARDSALSPVGVGVQSGRTQFSEASTLPLGINTGRGDLEVSDFIASGASASGRLKPTAGVIQVNSSSTSPTKLVFKKLDSSKIYPHSHSHSLSHSPKSPLRQSSPYIGIEGIGGEEGLLGEGKEDHGKFCMCGCRSY